MRIGYHVSKGKEKKIINLLKRSIGDIRGMDFKSPCAQIFVTGPRTYRETLTPGDKTAIKKYVDETGIQLVIHGAYVDYMWTKSVKSISNVMLEMRIARQIGASGVVVHLGAGATSDENLAFVFDQIGRLEDDVKEHVMLWLEINTAKPSRGTFETPAKIARLFERINLFNEHGLRIGLCVDTAHLHACGVSLDSRASAKKWIERLPDVPLMLHLNDSASERASGIDRHAGLCNGGIWRDYHPAWGIYPIEDSGLVYLLDWAESKNITVILERSSDDIIPDLMLIRSLGYK